jgi:tetratricopeptide (TPR) repeat protein
LTRHVGLRAERASLRAKAQRLERQGDVNEAAGCFAELFRLSVTSKSDYIDAIEAARRSLELRFDKELSGELVSLLTACGNWPAAVDIMNQSEALERMDGPTRRKLAALSYRSGDGVRAAIELTEIARLEPEATDVLHALGTLSYAVPEQVSRERGILAFHEAARRHRLNGKAGVLPAFEATLRAFELEPANLFAAERLAKELEAQGRREAADEVWRQSADAAHDTTRHDVRATHALQAGDVIAAFAALLDGRADVNFEEQPIVRGVEQLLSPRPGLSQGFDMVLSELGCADWLSVRLELGPLLERWSDESGAQIVLARLEAGYFAHLDQAREAYVRAIVAQPAQPEARARLTSLAFEPDTSDALFRALVQSARTAQGGLVARQLASELFDRCVRNEGSAGLALWSLERLSHSMFKGDDRAQKLEHWGLRAQSERNETVRLTEALSTASGEERLTLLKNLEQRLAFEPTETLEQLSVVRQLVELLPGDSVLVSRFVELIDVAAGLVISPSRDERLAQALATATRLLGERGRIAHARLLVRHGQIEQALTVLRPLIREPNSSVRGLLWVWTLARRIGDVATAACSIDKLAQAFRPAIRAVLEALAAQLYLEANDPIEALRVLNGALRTSQNVARLVTLKVALAEYFEPVSGAEDLEHALSRVVPNSAVCRVMAKTYRAASELRLSFVWAQRAVSLRPGDLELRREALSLALAQGHTEQVIELLGDLLKQALPVSGWEEIAASALAWLASAAPERAREIAPQILDVSGPSNRSLRAALLDTARLTGDESLAIEILERAAAAEAARGDRAEIQITLAERRFKRNELEACLRSALRAAQGSAPVDDWVAYAWVNTAHENADVQLLQFELLRLLSLQGEDRSKVNQVTRDLAVARFDFAQDTDGAVSLWTEYSQQTGSGGWPVAVRDMVEVLGYRATLTRLESLARFGVSGAERSLILVLSAQICEEMGDLPKARELVEAAVEKVPHCVFVLPLAERLLGSTADLARLEALYNVIERHVLGIFGVRALHYRAALAFVRRGQYAQALTHVIAAFETLPDYESSFNLLVYVSKHAAEPQSLASCVTRVAEAEPDRARAVRWLERAYDVLGVEDEELRLKFDLAIRILVGMPRVRAVRAVADCLSAMQSSAIEEIEFLRMRFIRALESLTGQLAGPDGARLGIAIVEVATTNLKRVDLATAALLSALKADADVDEFEALNSTVQACAALELESTRKALSEALDWLDRPYVAIGTPAVLLLARIAFAVLEPEGILRLERRTVQLGHPPWLKSFLLEREDEVWSQVEDARVLAIDIARVWLEEGDATSALSLLERGALARSKRANTTTDSGAEAREWADVWIPWLDAYSDCVGQLLPSVGIGALRERIQQLETIVPVVVVATVRVSLERAGGDLRTLSSALAELSFCGSGSAQHRSELLVEAAQLADRFGDSEGAMVYYRAACGTHRSNVNARFGLATLLYRVGRYKLREQAEFLLELTNGLELSVPDDVLDIVVYVRAQALEVLGRRADSCRLLEEAETKHGPRTFLVLGLAEYATKSEDYASALGFFAAALGGNLRELRRESEVALLAARAASAAGDVSLALSWLEPSLNDTLTRPEAITLQAELLGAVDALVGDDQAPSVVTNVVGSADTPEGGLLTREPMPIHRRSNGLLDAVTAPAAVEPETVLVELETSESRLHSTRATTHESEASRTGTGTAVTDDLHQPVATTPTSLPEHSVQNGLEQGWSYPEQSVPDVLEQGWSLPEQPIPEAAEPIVSVPTQSVPDMLEQGWSYPEQSVPDMLEQGWSLPEQSVPQAVASDWESTTVALQEPNADDFAIAIAEELKTDPERQRAWLPDGRRWLRQWPMNVRLIELVQSAAAVEGHHCHVQALAQVLSVLRNESVDPEPPELADQPVEVDVVRSLLMRDLMTPGAEALELIWDGAEHEFVREPSEYDVTGLMRVVGSASPIARIYADASRRLGMTRTPLFFRKNAQPLRVRILLLSPPALLIEGEPALDERALGYRIGSSLWATLPSHSLLFGLDLAQVQQVFKALVLAFGSGEGQADRTQGESLRLAQVLWQTVKSRSQRRLKEICRAELVFEESLQRASQAIRRAGLYVAGDLRTVLFALRDEVSESNEDRDPRALLAQIMGNPETLELFRFATSAEYADVRWQSGRTNQPGGGVRPW